MTTDLLNTADEGIDFGDQHVLSLIDNLHKTFDSGDSSALFTVIAICSRYQAVIPEWATDQILRIEQSIKSGEVKDFNAAFGWTTKHIASRRREARLEIMANVVLGELQLYRYKGDGILGGTLLSIDSFEFVAKKLGVSRRDVEDIYKLHGKFLKEQPIGKSENNATFGFSYMKIEPPRRRGRPILKD